MSETDVMACVCRKQRERLGLWRRCSNEWCRSTKLVKANRRRWWCCSGGSGSSSSSGRRRRQRWKWWWCRWKPQFRTKPEWFATSNTTRSVVGAALPTKSPFDRFNFASPIPHPHNLPSHHTPSQPCPHGSTEGCSSRLSSLPDFLDFTGELKRVLHHTTDDILYQSWILNRRRRPLRVRSQRSNTDLSSARSRP